MDDEVTCPDCDAVMVLRTNSITRERFWGCSNFPECHGTRRYDLDTMEVRRPDRDELPSDKYRRADKQRWRE